MGLIYSSGDSSALMGALSANLAAATAALDSTVSACDRLSRELGGGRLSGKAYAAAKAMFAEAIRPGVTKAKGVIDSITKDLDAYTRADSIVSQFGVLKEDDLNVQLRSVRAQRDATEAQIENNSLSAESLAAVPGLSEAMLARNAQLELVLTQLEGDVRELEDKLHALRAFASQTAGLFDYRLEEFVEAAGGLSGLAGYALDAGTGAVSVGKVYKYLDGKKLHVDRAGRVRMERKYLYDQYGSKMSPGGQSKHLYKNGATFNAAADARIDHYKRPVKAGLSGAGSSLADTAKDFAGWKGASTLTKAGKGLGIAGTVLTVGGNAYEYFADGVQGDDIRDFTIDTAVDLGSAAAAAGAGAIAGSFVLPPLGTILGAVAGLVASAILNAKIFGDKSIAGRAKDSLKDACNWLQSRFW